MAQKPSSIDEQILALKNAAKRVAVRGSKKKKKLGLRDDNIAVVRVEVGVPSHAVFSMATPFLLDANADFVDGDFSDTPDTDWPGKPDLVAPQVPEL